MFGVRWPSARVAGAAAFQQEEELYEPAVELLRRRPPFLPAAEQRVSAALLGLLLQQLRRCGRSGCRRCCHRN